MRKEKMVTRTFKETEVIAMVIDLKDNNAIYDMSDSFNGWLTVNESLTVFRKKWETDFFKVVAVKSAEQREVLRGMSESTFLLNSVILPPRTMAEQ